MNFMIGYNLLALGDGIGGIARYGFSLIATMAEMFPEKMFLVFLQKKCRFRFLQNNIKIHCLTFPVKSPMLRRFCEAVKLKGILRTLNFKGLLHSVNNVIPPISGLKQVVTIHDLLWWADPCRFPWPKKVLKV